MRRIRQSVLILVSCFTFSLSANSATGPAATYVGVAKCRVCHMQQYKSWQQTRMANAYNLLKPGQAADAKKKAKLDPAKDYTSDASCLACHTTGYGQPGGFKDIATTPELAGVTCESCHGPGSEYLKPNRMSIQNKTYKRAEVVAAGLVIPDKQACAACHNPKSPFVQPGASFDFEKRKSQGTHQHLPLQYAH